MSEHGAQERSSLIVIAGFNGLAAVQAWVRLLASFSRRYRVAALSWRDADRAAREAALSSLPVTLMGHSLGAGHAQKIAQRLPPGSIDKLITVAPFAPCEVDTEAVRAKVGHWLNIVSRNSWHSGILRLAGRCVTGFRDQGIIASASENYLSRFPHQDFYGLVSERCGEVGKGLFRLPDDEPPHRADRQSPASRTRF